MINALPYGPGLMDQLAAFMAAREKYGDDELDGRHRMITMRPPRKKPGIRRGDPVFFKGTIRAWVRDYMDQRHKDGSLTVTAEELRRDAAKAERGEGFPGSVMNCVKTLANDHEAIRRHSLGIYILHEKYRT